MGGFARSILALAALALLLASLASAQPQPGSQSISNELDRTDRILERVREQIDAASPGQAGSLLRTALEMQERARTSYHEGRVFQSRGERRRADATFQISFKRTLEARELARRAVESAAATSDSNDGEKVRDLIDAARDLLDRARSKLDHGADAQATRLLEEAGTQIQRAEDAYRARLYSKAARLAAVARDMTQRALDRAGDSAADAPAISLDVAFERTQSLLDEVRLGLLESPQAQARVLYDEAVRLQRRAHDLRRDGRGPIALRLTAQARQTALEALLLLARDPDREEVQRALDIVEQLAADLAPEIEASGSKQAAALLTAARERARDAASRLARGEASPALDAARQAEGLLRRAAEAAGMR